MSDIVAKNCAWCGKLFKPARAWTKQKFCTKRCRQEKDRSAHITHAGSSRSRNASTGAASELFICADLLRKGYEVFRAQSPTCSCDLIAMRGTILYRVEVKSGHYRREGVIGPVATAHDRYDILAVVMPDNIIMYKTHTGDWTP